MSEQEKLIRDFKSGKIGAAGIPAESRCRKCPRPHLPYNPLCGECESIAQAAYMAAPAAKDHRPAPNLVDETILAMRRKQIAFDRLQRLQDQYREQEAECMRLRDAEQRMIDATLAARLGGELRSRIKKEFE